MLVGSTILACSSLRDGEKRELRKRVRKTRRAGERQSSGRGSLKKCSQALSLPFPATVLFSPVSRSRASYFHVPFLFFLPSLLSESLEQASTM